MGYTFGAAATDDIGWTLPTALMSTTLPFLVAGWFALSTLTTGRMYWGTGTTQATGLAVGATTSELQLIGDRTTTDDLWDSTGAGITTGAWHFIAVLWTGSNAPAGAAKLWVGTQDARPAAITFTRTLGTGSVANAATMVAGNQNTGASVAIQGDIDLLWTIRAGPLGVSNLLGLNSSTAISAAEEEFVLQRFVLPMWAGQLPNCVMGNMASTTVQAIQMADLTMANPRALSRVVNVASAAGAPTVNGATLSLSRGPRPAPKVLGIYPQRIRR